MPVKQKKPSAVKSERILVRLTVGDKELIQRAADISERKLAEWVRMNSLQQARRVVDYYESERQPRVTTRPEAA